MMEGLEGLVNSSYRWMYSWLGLDWYSCTTSSYVSMEQENCVKEVLNREIYRMNNEISVLFLVKEMGNHVMMHDLQEEFNWKIK